MRIFSSQVGVWPTRCLSLLTDVMKTAVIVSVLATAAAYEPVIQIGPRPYYLANTLPNNSTIKSQLQSCSVTNFKKSDFAIGHRGATLMFPEESAESLTAGGHLGAGILECDGA